MELLTTKIQIEPYLAEYLIGKWGKKDAKGKPTGIVAIPDTIYLYHNLWSLTSTTPHYIKEDDIVGNVEIVLPNRKEGKDPRYYNYISEESAKIFNKDVKLFFRADLHNFLDKKKHDEGYTYKEAAYIFALQHDIVSYEVDSMTKNYARWRNNIRNRKQKAYSSR